MPRIARRGRPRGAGLGKLPPISNPQSISGVADWVEFYIAYYQQSLAKTALAGHLERNSGSEGSFDLDGIWSELERRRLLYG